MTVQTLITWLQEGAKTHKTILTEQHSFDRYLEYYQGTAVPLFVFGPKGAIRFFDSDDEFFQNQTGLSSLWCILNPCSSRVNQAELFWVNE